MFAVIATGGKQYTVSVGDKINVEKLDAKEGKKVNFDVLLISDDNGVVVGNPIVENAVCEAKVLGNGKEDKIVVFKYKPKKNERKKQGHRQPFTQVEIVSIKVKND